MSDDIKLNKTELIAECIISDSEEMKMARKIYFNWCVWNCEKPKFMVFCIAFSFFRFEMDAENVSVYDNEVDCEVLDDVMMELYISYNSLCRGRTKEETEFLESRKSKVTFKCENLTVNNES